MSSKDRHPAWFTIYIIAIEVRTDAHWAAAVGHLAANLSTANDESNLGSGTSQDQPQNGDHHDAGVASTSAGGTEGCAAHSAGAAEHRAPELSMDGLCPERIEEAELPQEQCPAGLEQQPPAALSSILDEVQVCRPVLLICLKTN